MPAGTVTLKFVCFSVVTNLPENKESATFTGTSSLTLKVSPAFPGKGENVRH